MSKIIKNFEQLVQERSGLLSESRRDVLEAVEKALEEVLPENALRRHVKRVGGSLIIKGVRYRLSEFKKIIVLGAGKASIGMASYIEKILLDKISLGAVVAPKEKVTEAKLKKIEVLPSTHPIPSMLGVRASEKILEYANSSDPETLVIFLLSGGASALLPLPAHPLTLEDKAETTRLLLKSGATIDEINIVRRHLSEIKGGRLLKKLNNARVISLIISDVVGDKLEAIGSGPTAPDPTTFKDALEVLKRYHIWEHLPERVRKRIEDGVNGSIEENPKPGDPLFNRVQNVIIASISDACEKAYAYLRSKKYSTKILTRYMEGEASEVGRFLTSLLREQATRKGRYSLICGGETTVRVRGHGIGGRNQELALSASIGIKDLTSCCLTSIGTDGVDGPTDVAGAIVDGETYLEAINKGINPIKYLSDNDSYTFFQNVGGHVITGPTGTNVGDLVIAIVRNE
ncbi:MAG: glycerate kinase [Aigarchaeota archaeon]|nr:glycerate kinase [Aigarchaeota archaeon]MCX8192212.1 glycerate kinase [Nitrososphaeria archaeon]MDW7986180.1 glycerate kinase [Nitrososphaerota archaeon]